MRKTRPIGLSAFPGLKRAEHRARLIETRRLANEHGVSVKFVDKLIRERGGLAEAEAQLKEWTTKDAERQAMNGAAVKSPRLVRLS